MDTVLVLLDRLLADFNIDRTRIYIEGAGMGAEGAFRIAQLRPTTFASVLVRDGLPPHYHTGIPFSDAAKVEELRKAGTLGEQPLAFPRLCNLRCTPVHWLHADQDTSTPTAHARQARDALKALGGEVVFTEYAGRHASALVPDFARFLAAGLVAVKPATRPATAVQGSRESDTWAGSQRCGWLQIVKQELKGAQTDWPELRQAGGTVQAVCERETNTLRVTAEGVSEVRIHLDDSLLYLDQPVKLVVNGKDRGTIAPVRRLDTIGESAVRYAHSNEAWSAAVTVEIR
ncbi:MAG: hypothetical protein IT463_09330 [Planctomycetes bacterium]|nr:hypothetical protein [Planctomycetota bacterium]